MSLICQNLIKTYRMGEVEVPALRGCSLTVEDGAFTMLTGASGCGKSTLLHCIAGVDRPDSGSIAIADTEITGLSVSDMAVFRRRSIGLIYQFFNLIPSLTILQNITLPLSLD
jgi:putative ABC transport system ATP-binding protein